MPRSEGHITAPPKATSEIDASIPQPVRGSAYVPPPKPAPKQQTYTVVVNEVPVKELLLALARDTRQNIDIHPALRGLVSLNAIDEPLPAILERISRQVSLRYKMEGNTIVVTPDAPYVKTYRVNYVNVERKVTSTVNVVGEVSAGQGSTGGAATPGTATGSRTSVTSTTSNDFWEQLRDNIRAILISTRRIASTEEERAVRAEEQRTAREDAIRQAEAVSRAGAGAADLMRNAFTPQLKPAATIQQSDTGTDVVINPISGTVTVLANERQHQLIQQHLDSILNAAQRQVLIEATIVEVTLSDTYQGGVDWSRLAVSGGITFAQSLLGGFGSLLTQAGANQFQVGYANPTTRFGNITAAVRMLQEFGNTKVLSSPKLMALNNQAALLKVVDNIVYFEVQAQANTTQGVATTTVNTTAKTVSVGVVMGVTPQVNEDGRVTLIVRPTISRVLQFKDDPNPSLVVNGQRLLNRVPEVQVREMESVLQVNSGQTVILGGLMQDDVRFAREQVPLLGDVKDVGEAFKYRSERAAKTELIIFLKPTVVPNASLESDELRFFQRFLPQAPEGSPNPGDTARP